MGPDRLIGKRGEASCKRVYTYRSSTPGVEGFIRIGNALKFFWPGVANLVSLPDES